MRVSRVRFPPAANFLFALVDVIEFPFTVAFYNALLGALFAGLRQGLFQFVGQLRVETPVAEGDPVGAHVNRRLETLLLCDGVFRRRGLKDCQPLLCCLSYGVETFVRSVPHAGDGIVAGCGGVVEDFDQPRTLIFAQLHCCCSRVACLLTYYSIAQSC